MNPETRMTAHERRRCESARPSRVRGVCRVRLALPLPAEPAPPQFLPPPICTFADMTAAQFEEPAAWNR